MFFPPSHTPGSAFQRFCQDHHCPPRIKDFFRCQKLDRLALIAFFCVFCIERYEFLVPAPLKAAGAVDASERWFWKEASKNGRNSPLSRSTRVSARYSGRYKKKPWARSWASSGEYPRRRRKYKADTNRADTIRLRRSAPLPPDLFRPHDDRPPRGLKARRALLWRTMVVFHRTIGSFSNINS